MFFVYDSQTEIVHEYKDLASMLDNYKKSHSQEDLFWTLGLKSWVLLSEIITDQLLRRRQLQTPDLPPRTRSLKPSPEAFEETNPIIVVPEKTEEEDFKIISYEPPKAELQNEVPAETVTSTNVAPRPKPGKVNQRRFPRYAIRLKVIISNKEKTFLSYTSNVSIGGVALEDNIPAEFFMDTTDTEIFISSPKKNEFLAFRCQPVGDEADPKRFSFGEISEESLNKFQQWIDKLKE